MKSTADCVAESTRRLMPGLPITRDIATALVDQLLPVTVEPVR